MSTVCNICGKHKLSSDLPVSIELWKTCDCPVPAQGTPEPPKVEEAVQELVKAASAILKMHTGDNRRRLRAAKESVEALRPYFPPASQTENLCGTAGNVLTSTNADTHPTAEPVERFAARHLPSQEWQRLSPESREKISKWFNLAEKYLQSILDDPLAIPATTARTDARKFVSLLWKTATLWDLDEVSDREQMIAMLEAQCAAPGSVPQTTKMATCPECSAQNQLTIGAFNGRIGLVCGACSQWWSIGEIEHTPYFFGYPAASNGPNKLRRCEVAGCKYPVWYGVKCDEHTASLNGEKRAPEPVMSESGPERDPQECRYCEHCQRPIHEKRWAGRLVWLDSDDRMFCRRSENNKQLIGHTPKQEPPICDCCGAGPMLDRGGFYDCFACGHNREKNTTTHGVPQAGAAEMNPDRYLYRSDGNFYVACVCLSCGDKFDAHAMQNSDPLGRCPACRQVDEPAGSAQPGDAPQKEKP